jgi:trehalose-6-phosphatase
MYTEKQMINALNQLEKHWNNKYWLFSASGSLHLMKYSKDQQRLVTPDGGMSPEAIIETFLIPSDGGDW